MTLKDRSEGINLDIIPRTASFVKFIPNIPGALGRSMDVWAPEVTGDWTIDCSRGKAYAEEAIEFMQRSNNPTCLGHIVKAMIGNGAYTGVEVGFMHRIGELVLASSSG